MERMNNLLIGGGGIALVDTTPHIINTIPMDAPNIVQVIVQLIIGVVTLIGLFKKKKSINQ
jgi:uncharacterized membrane protein YphA (DoxX/SURF4 family)